MLKTFSLGGIHPAENKLSANSAIEILPVPESVSVPISQHIGAPSEPVVKKGDAVKTGQLIAKSTGFVSANIHSPVSGIVQKVEDVVDASGYRKMAIIIKTEGNEWIETIDQSKTINRNITATGEEIIKKISEMGLVGLGGATFPSHVKLAVPPGKICNFLIINAVECEPYLTCDHRLMLERLRRLSKG